MDNFPEECRYVLETLRDVYHYDAQAREQAMSPDTAREKFKVTLRSSFDPGQFVWYGSLAGISQAENSERGYHQGGAGYARRYGAYIADGSIENLTTEAILPSLLHQGGPHSHT